MANYYGKTRTNYFRVTDESKFYSIVHRILTDDDVKADASVMEGKDGRKYFCFYADSAIAGLSSDVKTPFESTPDDVYRALQEIVPENEVIVIEEIGSEKLRYFVAAAVLITDEDIHYLGFHQIIQEHIRQVLGLEDYNLEIM